MSFRIPALTLAGALVLLSPELPAVPLAAETFQDYLGTGLRPGGGGGSLDSNRWSVLGASDGAAGFGATVMTGDLARGIADGPVRGGGLYAFALPGGVTGLGVQATASDFNPGALLWRPDAVGPVDDTLWLTFELWSRNDGDRSTRVSVSVSDSTGLAPWSPLPAVSVVTPTTATSGAWQSSQLRAMLPTSPEALLMKFELHDAGGRGARDEIALAALRIDASRVTAPATFALVLLGPLVARAGRRSCIEGPRT